MTETGRTTGRRTLVGGIVGLGVATPLLAACGSSPDDASATTKSSVGSKSTDVASGASKSNGGSDPSPGGAIGKTTDIPVGGGKIYNAEKVVVTQPTKGNFKAFSAICTHQGCLVAEIKGGDIDCNCHGSKFSIKDGSVVSGPASEPLKQKTATVKGLEITVS